MAPSWAPLSDLRRLRPDRRRPVPVPERVTAFLAAVQGCRVDRDRHEVSGDSFSRACRIARALAAEAERRGYGVKAVEKRRPVRLKDGQLEIVISDFRYRLRIRERGKAVRRSPARPGGGGCLAGKL